MFYLVQMAGVPGSGKSAVAQELARQLPATLLDHDDTKSALLLAGISEVQAGPASYAVIKALASRALELGGSCIIDSPCFYRELLAFGQDTAARFGAHYRFVECVVPDLVEIRRRIKNRNSKPSQFKDLDDMVSHAGATPRRAEDLMVEWLTKTVRPSVGGLNLDTSRPPAECVELALSYIKGPG